MEIERLRREVKVKYFSGLGHARFFVAILQKMVVRLMEPSKLAQVRGATNVASAIVQNALLEGDMVEDLKLWRIYKEHLNNVSEKGGATKGWGITMHPTLLIWCISFLALTSASVYEEVCRVMKLPSISYIYRNTVVTISTMADKAYAINIVAIREMGERAVNDALCSTLPPFT